MNFFSYIIESLGTLLQNKMRSFLSLLGIVIGISSVVILTAIGDGMKADIVKNMISTQNIITIAPWPVSRFSPFEMMQWKNGPHQQNEEIDISQKIAAEKIFKIETIEKLQKIFKNSVSSVLPIMNFKSYAPVIYNWKEVYSSTTIVNPSFFEAKKLKIWRWMMFSPYQIKNSEKVVILGFNAVKNLNENEKNFSKNSSNNSELQDPVGKKIFINNTAFTIVGILEKSDNYNVDYNIFIPHSTVVENFGEPAIEKIELYAKNIEDMHEIQKNVGYYLMKITGAEIPETIQFHLETNEAALKEVNEMIWKLSLFVSGIAGISLFVGGIGIMNIMLVSVTERTREIGIRKAIGAKRSDIILQFLTESGLLSMIGGILAIIFSFGITKIISMIFPINPILSLNTIMIATIFSIFMGVIFGLIPAWKAAKMDAIEALRFE